MGQLTNVYGIPQAIVAAVMRPSDYNSGKSDLTASMIDEAPRIIQLRKRHADEIVEDAADRIWALLGQIVHKILEKADDYQAFDEERIFIKRRGWIISGQTDVYTTRETVEWAKLEEAMKRLKDREYNEDVEIALDRYYNEFGRDEIKLMEELAGTIVPVYKKIAPLVRDYKFVKTGARYFNKKHEPQLNICAHLFREHGFEVTGLEVINIYRDWSPEEAARRSSYPPPVEKFPQKLWSPEKAEDYIDERILLHKSAAQLPDELLPFCTDEDKWQRPTCHSVMKPKRASAVRNFYDKEGKSGYELAQQFIKTQKKPESLYIDTKPGEPVRCLRYCDVAPFCNQFKMWKERN